MSCSCEELQVQLDLVRKVAIGNAKLNALFFEYLQNKEKERKNFHIIKEQYDRLKELKQLGKKFNEEEQAHFDEIEAVVKEYF